MDKLGVLRPLSLPPVGDAVGRAMDMKGKKGKGLGGKKGCWGGGGAKGQRYGRHIDKAQI